MVLTSLSCSSCLCPRRYRYSMCITSVFLMPAFCLKSSRIRGMKPGLSCPARRNCRYRARICFCSLLCLAIRQTHSPKITNQVHSFGYTRCFSRDVELECVKSVKLKLHDKTLRAPDAPLSLLSGEFSSVDPIEVSLRRVGPRRI